MISRAAIEEFTKKYQTLDVNIAREYCQHLFLQAFYQQKQSERVLFKGGTALRIAYGSPRFSEDLDFSCFGLDKRSIETMVLGCAGDIENSAVACDIGESKNTSGGYLGILNFSFLDFTVAVRLECSGRNRQPVSPDVLLVDSAYLPAFNIFCLPCQQLVREKVSALLARAKPRDFYDLYFLLRANMSFDKHKLPALAGVRQKLETCKIDFKRELKFLLPRSHHSLLNNFKKTLQVELHKYGY